MNDTKKLAPTQVLGSGGLFAVFRKACFLPLEYILKYTGNSIIIASAVFFFKLEYFVRGPVQAELFEAKTKREDETGICSPSDWSNREKSEGPGDSLAGLDLGLGFWFNRF